MGKYEFPDPLRSAGVAVERHCDHFAHDTPDQEWLRAIGNQDWIALTHNKDIYYTPVEKEAVMRSGVPLLILIGRDPHADLAKNFLATLPKIERFIANHNPPYIAKVKKRSRNALKAGKPGRIEMWLTEEGWKREQRSNSSQ